MIIDTVLMNIAIIGEIVKKLTENVKKRYPDIPQKDITGVRKVIHGYFDVDINIAWDAVQKDVPGLEQKTKLMLRKL